MFSIMGFDGLGLGNLLNTDRPSLGAPPPKGEGEDEGLTIFPEEDKDLTVRPDIWEPNPSKRAAEKRDDIVALSAAEKKETTPAKLSHRNELEELELQELFKGLDIKEMGNNLSNLGPEELDKLEEILTKLPGLANMISLVQNKGLKGMFNALAEGSGEDFAKGLKSLSPQEQNFIQGIFEKIVAVIGDDQNEDEAKGAKVVQGGFGEGKFQDQRLSA